MLERIRLITRPKVAAAIALLLISITACVHRKPPPPEPPKIVFSENYDPQIKEIMDLATKDRWEEARTNALSLYLKDPKNPILIRVRTWVEQQAQQRRA